MRRKIEVALVALALIGAPLATMAPAAADVRISVNPDTIAFGYSDGYWDRDHHWHAWRHKSDAQWYRAHYAGHYVNSRHDRQPGKGWHDSDRWWDHH